MAEPTPESFLIDVPIPSMGATVHELTIIDVMVKAGDSFAKGDKIAELESDKSVFEFEAPCDGMLDSLTVRAGISCLPGHRSCASPRSMRLYVI